jgi:hypothetical protein
MRSAKVAPGKYLQAVQWGKEIAEYINKKYKLQVSVYADSFGEVGTVRWFSDYPDLGTMEKVGDQILADQEYWAKLNQSIELFQPGFTDIAMRNL